MRVHGQTLVVAAAVLLAVSTAFVQTAQASRPTSGDVSILSGRTVGVDQTILAAGLGWPGAWAELMLAPSSTFNLALRGSVLYGSPIMGVGTGVGGEVSVPMRLHVFGRGQLDVALALTPSAVLGEGSLVGETSVFQNDLGWAGRLEAGLLAGAHVSDAVTITLGLAGSAALTGVPNRPNSTHLVGTALAIGGVEALMSADTMLFAEAAGGYGFAPADLYDGHGAFRVSLGLAYLL